MHIISFIFALLFTAVTASPVSKRAGTDVFWAFEKATRTCTAAQCDWSFYVSTGDENTSSPCNFVVEGANAWTIDLTAETPCVSNANSSIYYATTGYDASGFTVVAVKSYKLQRIAWPAYTDAELGTAGAATADRVLKTWTFDDPIFDNGA